MSLKLEPQRNLRHYTLREKIGQGGMSEVWCAWDARRNEEVALKAIAFGLIDQPGFEELFMDVEAKMRFDHPAIVPIYDCFVEEDRCCLIMKLIPGGSLQQRLVRVRQLEVSQSVAISLDILAALDHAHRKGVIHWDVTPSNILLDRDDRAYLMDFGIALAVRDIDRGYLDHDFDGGLVARQGKRVTNPSYMSPEQIRNPKDADDRSNIYSFGCVLYEMLTGRPPFHWDDRDGDGRSDFEIKRAHVCDRPRPPIELNPKIPAALNSITLRALEKDPANRFSGCGQFANVLRQGQKSGWTIPISRDPAEDPAETACATSRWWERIIKRRTKAPF